MKDDEILKRIGTLVDDEHSLRQRLRAGEISADEERARLAELEGTLDQCWDLLRQRRARREAGENPEDAKVRAVGEVEGYRQ